MSVTTRQCATELPRLTRYPSTQTGLLVANIPLMGSRIGIRAVVSDNTQKCLGRSMTWSTAFTQAEQETRLVLGERIT